MKIKAKQNFLQGAFIISLGGIVAKILGACYRIPLANILGAEGLGIYQMVYPLYCLLLTISATGIPSGLARMVSKADLGEGYSSKILLKKALLLFATIGIAASLLMFFLSPLFALIQNENKSIFAYRILAPSVLFVSIISCFRGYFQGKSNFIPTATSEIIEQLIKVLLGLTFLFTFKNITQEKLVGLSLLAVTISEGIAMLFMFFVALKSQALQREESSIDFEKPTSMFLLRGTIPVTFAAGLLPLSNMIDSILIVNILKRKTEDATYLYGLFSAGATTLVALPASICYGLAAVSVPTIASLCATGENIKAEEKIVFAIKCTLFVAMPAALFLQFYAPSIAQLLFPKLVQNGNMTLVLLIQCTAFACLFLALTQTLSACLTGMGKAKVAAISMAIAVTVKLILESILLFIPKVSILGAGIAVTACYLVAFIINFVYSIRENKMRISTLYQITKFGAISLGAILTGLIVIKIHVLLSLLVASCVYLFLCYVAKVFDREEFEFISFKRKKRDEKLRQD